jgi:hypothetical protein
MRIPMISGDEVDYLPRRRPYLPASPAGERHRIKRGYRRRERRIARLAIHAEEM